MAQLQGFSIEAESRYAEWWRYNVAMMCACFDEADRRIGFVSAESVIAPVGANLPAPPRAEEQKRKIALATPPCDHILLYAYIIPHTLPDESDIDASQPFDFELKVSAGGRRILADKRKINQWSGASIEWRIPAADADGE